MFASFCKAAHYIPVIDENYADCGHSGYLSLEGLELVALNGTVRIFEELFNVSMILFFTSPPAHGSEREN